MLLQIVQVPPFRQYFKAGRLPPYLKAQFTQIISLLGPVRRFWFHMQMLWEIRSLKLEALVAPDPKQTVAFRPNKSHTRLKKKTTQNPLRKITGTSECSAQSDLMDMSDTQARNAAHTSLPGFSITVSQIWKINKNKNIFKDKMIQKTF